MEDITYADYKQAERVWKHFKIKNLGNDCNLYFQSDLLLLSAAFEGFHNQHQNQQSKDVEKRPQQNQSY